MKNRKQLLTALLALATLGAVMASCGDASDAGTSDVTNAATTAATDAEVVTEAEYMPNLPAKDYGGRDFMFITSSDADDNGVDWVTKDIYAEEATGDVITDAVYERNLYIEDTYNVKIKEYQCIAMTETKKAVQAGVTDYDATMTSVANGCTLGSGNFVLDLNTVPYLNLKESYWDQNVTENTTIAGKTYFATGDITIVDNEATWVMMYNKAMAQSLDFDFYDLVKNNQWDMETFYDCAKAAAKDLNGDGKMAGADDQYGFATSDQSSQGLMYASGVMLSGKDKEGYPTIETDTSFLTDVVIAAGQIMSDLDTTIITGKAGVTTSDDLRLLFEGGRALFFGEVMACVTRMRNSDTDFGLIPFPKYDLAQDRYYHFMHKTAGKGLCIPTTQPDTEMAGIIIEAMAAKSVYTVTEAYYDKALTYKYMRDEESVEMLDLILDSRVYDMAYIFDWGGIFNSVFALITNGKDTVASTWDKKIKSAEKALDKTITAYKENE